MWFSPVGESDKISDRPDRSIQITRDGKSLQETLGQFDMPEEIKRLNKLRDEVSQDIVDLKPVVPSRLYRGDESPEKYVDIDSHGNSTINKDKFIVH